ncbi:hypothetical protein RWK44_08325 [Rhizobium sp. 25PS6]|uniref:hypothetical protein n=1 Tax=Rhizobium TaxID=379 RepID=UPI001C8FE3F5|nr:MULTISPECIES: hypothetical protein [Rhizobium]MBY3182241.1 hypothetical protein [Rhizobium laguerreae]MDU0360415.1 hypothetical protein [Rhizobium sp. 25PS6]
MTKIHIVGSEPRNSTNFEEMKLACAAIGKEIASRGFGVVIGSLRPHTADYHVIQGMSEVDCISEVTFFRKADEPPVEETELPKGKFKLVERRYQGNRHLTALLESQAIVVIGGQSGTSTAGFAAFSLKRPVLAVPQFGGAAKEIWDAVSSRYGQVLTHAELDTLSAKWGDSSASCVVNAAIKLSKNNPFDDRVQHPQIYLSAFTLILIAAWMVLFNHGSQVIGNVNYALFFLMIGISSVIGTITRTLIKVYFDVVEVFSSKKILSDFVLGIIVGFGFFLILQASGILLTGDKLNFNAQTFQRLSVFMSLVTFASAFLLERSIERFRERMEKYADLDVETPRK